jgi:hypothetical protein
VQVGRLGSRYPINSATYRCLYLAMSSQLAGGGDPGLMQIIWFADGRQNAGGQFGATGGITLYPEGAPSNPDQGWRLYRVDLAAPGGFDTGWNQLPRWQGLRIDPSNKANVTFNVDWIRLTSCGAANTTVTWTPNGGANAIWLRPTGTSRPIRVATGVNGAAGSAQIDVQGLAAGSYDVGIGTSTSCCASFGDTPLVINQRPLASFTNPSFSGGVDYASQAGTPWDFSDTRTATVTSQGSQAAWAYKDGMLEIVTPSGPLPAGIDVRIRLNAPVPANSAEYRYLTFRMNTGWKAPWANVPHGMIGRWIWTIPGPSGRGCDLVSFDIPYDIGWQTYSIDLHDPVQGRVEESSGRCPSLLPNWKSSGTVTGMRFDPNENITVAADKVTGGGPFTQQFDWMRLTKDIQVKQGAPYLVEVGLNKPAGQVTRTYYYTTDRNNPTQNRAAAYNPPAPGGSVKVFIAQVAANYQPVDAVANPASFAWDTSNVAPGTYYLCVNLNDGVSENTVCGEAPVVVGP